MNNPYSPWYNKSYENINLAAPTRPEINASRIV